jgi:regulatory protein
VVWREDTVNRMRSLSREPAARRSLTRIAEGTEAGGVISGISPHPRREGRFDVVVDGKRAAVLSADAVQRLGLHTGDAWTSELAARVSEEAEAVRVFDRALAMLASRGRSVRELRLALLQKREPAPLVDAAVARLLALGLLNDELFARQFVRSRMERAGFSTRRLQAELARRGVERAAIDAAIAEVREEEQIDPAEMLERLASRKLRAMTKLDPPTRRRRLLAFLSRRGYDFDEIRALITRLDV